MSYKATQFGFEWGSAIVERCCEDKGYVVIMVRAKQTGKFVEVVVSPGGRSLRVIEGRQTTRGADNGHEQQP